MSDTDKTRPLHVQMWDEDSKIRKVAVHDHRFSECDLPENLEEYEAQMSAHRFYGDGRCVWRFEYNGIGVCACSACHAPEAPSKAERRKMREKAHDWVRLANSQYSLDEDFE